MSANTSAASRGNAKVTQKELNEKFDSLKTILRNIKSTKGLDLYTHLQEVFKKLILHYPDHALEKLEEVSYLLKHNDTLRLEDYLKVSDMRNYKNVCEQMSAYIGGMREYFGQKKPAEDGEEEEPEAAAPVGFVPDLLEEAQVWQWAGIGLSQQELYRLQKSLKKLSGDSGAGRVRFWGKIRGTSCDYYVAEGEVEGGDEEGGEERPADFEAPGTGINKFTYWVAHSSLSAWNKLPDLSPKDVAAARGIKVLFSGDLQRTIYTNPFFFGKEQQYLRAQIARISHSTTLCPKGLFKLTEDAPRDIEADTPEEGDIVLPSTKDMQQEGMWVHHQSGILQNCRTAHMDPEVPEGEEIEPEELLKRIEAKDPYDPRLKPIATDRKVTVSKSTKMSPWVVKLMGDSNEYKTEQGKQVSNGVVVVRSLQWPGAFNFYNHGKYTHIYVGTGHKYEEVSFFPVHPPPVLSDPSEYQLQPEPTPLTEPVVEEKKEEEGEPAEEEDE